MAREALALRACSHWPCAHQRLPLGLTRLESKIKNQESKIHSFVISEITNCWEKSLGAGWGWYIARGK